jgi:hypothetical protein
MRMISFIVCVGGSSPEVGCPGTAILGCEQRLDELSLDFIPWNNPSLFIPVGNSPTCPAEGRRLMVLYREAKKRRFSRAVSFSYRLEIRNPLDIFIKISVVVFDLGTPQDIAE